MITIALNDDYNKMMQEYAKNIQLIAEAISAPLGQVQAVQNAIKDAISSIKFPKIEFPVIEFPVIEFPTIEVDWERIKALTEHNSLHGWTLTGEMDIKFYLDKDLLYLDQTQLDNSFVSYYESDFNKNYLIIKSNILDEIDDRWKNVLEDCFELYEAEKYRVIIPFLITVVEGEISDIAMSNKVGNGLLREWKGKVLSKEEEMLVIISHSLIKYLTKMFLYKEFTKERGSVINRNWVLHGRDNPNYWTKVDALKLINVLSTLQIIKEK